jgi:hypothetical protein
VKSSCGIFDVVIDNRNWCLSCCLPFKELMLGPKICSAIAMSSCVIGLLVMRFIQMIDLKSASDGVPRAW